MNVQPLHKIVALYDVILWYDTTTYFNSETYINGTKWFINLNNGDPDLNCSAPLGSYHAILIIKRKFLKYEGNET